MGFAELTLIGSYLSYEGCAFAVVVTPSDGAGVSFTVEDQSGGPNFGPSATITKSSPFGLVYIAVDAGYVLPAAVTLVGTSADPAFPFDKPSSSPLAPSLGAAKIECTLGAPLSPYGLAAGAAGTVTYSVLDLGSNAGGNFVISSNAETFLASNTLGAIGGLPPGLALDPGSGIISGTPTASGTYLVALVATTASGGNLGLFQFLVSGGITTGPLSFQRNIALSDAEIIQTDSGITTADWTVTGLPPGLATGASTASYIQLTGTPTLIGTYPVTVTVAQTGSGTPTHTATINITITPGIPVVAIPSSLWDGSTYTQTSAAGAPVSIDCTATDAPTSWAATGLPSGVTIDATGLISGTPSAAGTFAIAITATNAVGTGAAVYLTLVITQASSGGGSIGSSGSSGTAPSAAAPVNYLPWLHSNPMLIDLQMDQRTGLVTSFYAPLRFKAGDDLQLAVVVQDNILGTLLGALNDLYFVIVPVGDFETIYAEARGVEATSPDGINTYFALEVCLDPAACPELARAFQALNVVQGPNPAAQTIAAMAELRLETTAQIVRRSRLFNIVIEQNASW